MEDKKEKPDWENSSSTLSDELSEESKALLTTTAENFDFEKEVEWMQQKESSSDLMNKTFKKSGLVGLATMINRKMSRWQEEEVNIAVTGRTGVGKSCFINAVRSDMNESHPDYAPVGSNECTSKRHPYPHPANKHLIFWDLPGVGTANFPRKTYLKNKDIKFQSYDAFIIMACDRFTEDEIWLGNELRKLGKTFLFVRSKVDNQIQSDKLLKEKANKETDPQAVIDDIRNDCKKNLGDKFDDIYLINNLDLQQANLDFMKLIDRLIYGFQGLKAEVFLQSIGFLTSTLLEEKFKILRKRIWGIGVLSSIAGAVPIPGTSLIVDALLIVNETRIYRKQLGLTDDDMKVLAALMDMPVDELAETYSLKTLRLPLTVKGVLASTVLLASEVGDSSTLSLAFPDVGLAEGAVLSFGTTVKLLRSILAIMEVDAKMVLKLLIQSIGKNVIQLMNQSHQVL